MKMYLGLGSNLGNRKGNLELALIFLKERAKAQSFRISHLYETHALLPDDAPQDWNTPFLNCAVEIQTDVVLNDLLNITKGIEKELGRKERTKWAPRELDIDILYADGATSHAEALTVPHLEVLNRAFTMDPLKDLNPTLKIGDVDLLNVSRRHSEHAPTWMGIVNV
jgi:2-amino-4-hydroxy-6-hydroxymethyldihydropteridine diphosphokinase